MTQKSILFDLDGTLTDSGEGIMKSAVYALSHYGIPEPPAEVLRTIVGPPLDASFIRLGVPADKAAEAIQIYRSRYIPTGRFENSPYPGIRELLEQLLQDGHKLFVATSKPEWIAKEVLEHFDLAKYFTMICGASTDFSRNSKEAVIAYLLEECGAQEHAIMVGDTKFDVIGAKVHGIPCIGVAWGYGLVEEMENAGAAAIAYTMEQLYEMLR
ncbi:MAG: HAD-IA family hydrolase [Oscillospiraceae bacterium]|nr:HAD-IA family hydrolase [Oscillospiraceae bacterium]